MVIDRVAEFIRQYQMIAPGDVVLTGFSGGADSVLLLELLRELAKKGGFQVQAVHVHHNLRGEEADRDAAFAEAFCAEREIPFFLYSCPVEEVARKEHLSLEEAGRLERRRVFRECMEAHGGTKVALAHHRNDLAETMIHHLARGTSLAGLASLRPVRGNFIRPLLCLERAEIEKELERRKIVWCDDSTNGADDYTRNGIRHHVIPYLERQVNERTVAHMAETSLDLLEAEEYFCDEAEKLFRNCCVRREDGLELQECLAKEAKILQRYVVRDCLEQLAGQRKDLGREHLESVLDLFEKQVGKRVCLPYGLEAVRSYDGVVLRSYDGKQLVNCYKVISMHVSGSADTPNYVLYGVDSSSFWGENREMLGWYADEESVQKETADILAAIETGKPSYELKYAAKVKKRFLSVELVKEERKETTT